MKKVFLDNVPKKGKLLDWANSVGVVVSFVYDDISGEIKIIKYLKEERKLVVEYNGKQFYDRPISISSFSNCGIGYYLGKVTSEFKLDTGIELKDEKRSFYILNRFKKTIGKKNLKYYECHCYKCGYNNCIEESSLIKGSGCSVCDGKKVVFGINDMYTTDYWMVKLGVSEDDAKKYTKSSGKEIIVKCPDCKKEKSMVIRNIYNFKSICCSCKDGVSYPEKFIMSIFDQLGVSYTRQLSLDNNETRYDFYLKKHNLIIEVHGMQHYKSSFEYCGGRTLKEEQDNDLYKLLLAKIWGYNYISIDCRYSNLEWIKGNVLKSKLATIFDLNKIIWEECGKVSSSNIVKNVCDYWNTKGENETTRTIAKKFNLSNVTIQTYLKKGTEVGWCNYDAIEEKRRSASRSGKKTGKKVSVFKLSGEYVGTFNSASELERISEKEIGVKLYQANISYVISGKVSQHKGFTFEYIV